MKELVLPGNLEVDLVIYEFRKINFLNKKENFFRPQSLKSLGRESIQVRIEKDFLPCLSLIKGHSQSAHAKN